MEVVSLQTILNNNTMCVHGIPKADTFGEDDHWQIHERVRNEVKDHLRDNLHNIYEEQIDEEQIDDVIKALYELGYVILMEV